ncbi:MAG: DUF4097 family beta strand repeat protein [Thermoactinospora sp.]|nr:DUF4097 family beta strand repeat protein [Thermoactinospora sp.]
MKKMAIAGALAAAALLTGCGVVGGPTQQEEISYDVPDKVAKLVLDSESGDIVVNESDRAGIRVVETRHWNNDKPNAQHKVNGDTLDVSYTCPDDFVNNCSVDYRLEVPKGLELTLETGSGDLTLRTLSGVVRAKSGSGDISASGLVGKLFRAETGSGDVELKYASTPDEIKVETGSGNATVWVPQGPYDVQTKTGSGATEVAVTDEPGATRKISLETGSGDVKVLLG